MNCEKYWDGEMKACRRAPNTPCGREGGTQRFPKKVTARPCRKGQVGVNPAKKRTVVMGGQRCWRKEESVQWLRD